MAQCSWLKLPRVTKIPSPSGLSVQYFQQERGRFYRLACDAFLVGNRDDCHWQAILSKHRTLNLNVRAGDGGENSLVLQPVVKPVLVRMASRVEHLYALTTLPSQTVPVSLSRMNRFRRNRGGRNHAPIREGCVHESIV
jgi:hypothetical protein